MKKMILMLVAVSMAFSSCGEKSTTVTKKAAPQVKTPQVSAFSKVSVSEYQEAMEKNIESLSTVKVGQRKVESHSNIVVMIEVRDDNDAEDLKSSKSWSAGKLGFSKGKMSKGDTTLMTVPCVGKALIGSFVTKVDVENNKVIADHSFDFVPHPNAEETEEVVNHEACFATFPSGNESGESKEIYTSTVEYELTLTKENIENVIEGLNSLGAEISRDNKSGNYLLSYKRDGDAQVNLELNLNNHYEDIEVKGSYERVLDDGRRFVNEFSADITKPDMTCEGIDCGEQDDEEQDDEEQDDEEQDDEEQDDEEQDDEEQDDEDAEEGEDSEA